MTAASSSAPTAMMVSPMAGRSLVAPPPSSVPPLVMSRQPELFENSFDARRLGVEERLVVVAGERDLGPFARPAGLRPLRRCGHLLDERNHRLALSVVDAGRCEHAAPVEQLDVDALLLQRRGLDPRLALVGRYGDQAQLPGLDLLGKLAVARDAGRHLVAEQRRGRRSA